MGIAPVQLMFVVVRWRKHQIVARRGFLRSFFRSPKPQASLVPTFFTQPLLQGVQMNFGVATTKALDVRLVAVFVEPAKHRVELLAENQAYEGQRDFAKLHRFAHNGNVVGNTGS